MNLSASTSRVGVDLAPDPFLVLVVDGLMVLACDPSVGGQLVGVDRRFAAHVHARLDQPLQVVAAAVGHKP